MEYKKTFLGKKTFLCLTLGWAWGIMVVRLGVGGSTVRAKQGGIAIKKTFIFLHLVLAILSVL
jgi:hypothetical protein